MKDVEYKLQKIKAVIRLAEEWCKGQEMSEDMILLGAMKDIRRIVNEKTPKIVINKPYPPENINDDYGNTESKYYPKT